MRTPFSPYLSKMHLSAYIINESGKKDNLHKELLQFGFSVSEFNGAQSMMEDKGLNPPLLLLTNLNLSDADAFEVIEWVRQQPKWSNTLIIVRANFTVESFKVMLLNKGADEVIPADISPRLFSAQLAAMLRRSYGAFTLKGTINGDQFHADPVARTIELGSREEILLSEREYQLFSLLSNSRNKVMTRESILLRLWGQEKTSSRVVDVYVQKLRNKLGSSVIQTVNGKGYRISE